MSKEHDGKHPTNQSSSSLSLLQPEASSTTVTTNHTCNFWLLYLYPLLVKIVLDFYNNVKQHHPQAYIQYTGNDAWKSPSEINIEKIQEFIQHIYDFETQQELNRNAFNINVKEIHLQYKDQIGIATRTQLSIYTLLTEVQNECEHEDCFVPDLLKKPNELTENHIKYVRPHIIQMPTKKRKALCSSLSSSSSSISSSSSSTKKCKTTTTQQLNVPTQ